MMKVATVLCALLCASVSADTVVSRPALRSVRGEVQPAAALVQKAPQRQLLRGGSSLSDVTSMIKIPREAQLLIASAGIFFSFSIFAIKQEDVYKQAFGGELGRLAALWNCSASRY